MDFHWAGDNAVEEGDVAGSINLSPVLKRSEMIIIFFFLLKCHFFNRHNAYLVHNETVYCNEEDEWRGMSVNFIWQESCFVEKLSS